MFRIHQSRGAFLHQFLDADAVNQINRVEHIALGLAHLLPFRVADQAVHIHVPEWDLASEVFGHHHHARHPEKDDVETGDQHGRRQIFLHEFVLRVERLVHFPIQCRERPQRGREPGIEHVVIAVELPGVTGFVCQLARLVGITRNEHFTVGAVPRRNLVAPPQLARDAPILDIVQPLVVGVDPVLGVELDLAGAHAFQCLLGDGFAFRARLAHRDEPLVGEHRLDHHAGAVAARHFEFVLFGLLEQAECLKVGHDLFARFKAVEPLIFCRRLFVNFCIQGEDGDHFQPVALAHRVVVEIMRRGNLHATRAEFLVHVVVGDDGNSAVAQR